MYANKKDGAPWSDGDLEDLYVSIVSGLSVAQAATALSREGTIEDILITATKQGWRFHDMNGYQISK